MRLPRYAQIRFKSLLRRIVESAVQREERRRARRAKHRGYLTRAALTPNPRLTLQEDVVSPWTALLASGEDRGFLVTRGINVSTFEHILNNGFTALYEERPLKRNDNQGTGSRMERRSLDAAGVLGLALHWATSTMDHTALCQIFAVTPTCCARYLDFGLDLLHDVLHKMTEARIAWPKAEEFPALAARIQARRGSGTAVNNTFGFVDGCKLPIKQSLNDLEQSVYYNGWKSAHYVSNVFAFDTYGCIIWASLNNPGSYHDSTCSKGLYERLKNQTPEPYNVVADTAFPFAGALAGKILKPLKSGDKMPASQYAFAREVRTSHEVTSERQAAEWGMRSLQGTFPRLYMPSPASDHVKRLRMLTVITRLHNVRTRMVGINQIRTVYDEAIERAEANQSESQAFVTLADMYYKETFQPENANAQIARFYHNEL